MTTKHGMSPLDEYLLAPFAFSKWLATCTACLLIWMTLVKTWEPAAVLCHETMSRHSFDLPRHSTFVSTTCW